MRQCRRTLGAIMLGAMALVATERAVAQADTTAPRVTQDTAGKELAPFVDRAAVKDSPATVPQTPENLYATRYGNRTMTLRWGVPRSGGSPILKYQVRHALGRTPAGEWTNVAGGGNARSHVFRNLASSSSYTFQVRAVNAAGAGEEESITKTTLSAPTRVRYLRATAGNARVILRWVPPLSVGGEGAFVLRYEYQQRAGSGSWSEWRYAADAWQRGQVVTGLANGTDYSFRMRAVNQDLAGPESIPESSTPAPQLRLSVHPGHFVVGGESTTAMISVTDGYVLETDTTFEVTDPWRRTLTGLPPTATQSMGSTDMTVTRGIRLPDDDVKNGHTWITFTIRRRAGDDSYNLGTSTVKVLVIDDETP